RIAHEMGNQLCMLPLLEMIEEQYAGDVDLIRTADVARKTYERLVQLVGEVKAFVRFENEDAPLQNVRISELLHELLDFLRFDNSVPHARISLQIGEEAVVRANRVKLHQVLINLLKNAAHAIREREDGRITLSLAVDASTAEIKVSDNGCGMTAEVAERIWEPFFTTKGDDGNGLGLDIVKEIVEAHGGQISCQTAPGAGTTFTAAPAKAARSACPPLVADLHCDISAPVGVI